MTFSRHLLALALLVALPGLARAQPETGAPPAGPEAAESDAETTAMDEARDRFRQGLTLARAGNCVGALAEFEASLAIVERPNTLFNAARCQEELFRYDLAVADYERYLAIAPPDDPDRAAVEASMRSMRSLLGTIVVSLNTGDESVRDAEVWVGDRRVGTAPGEVLIPGGRHSLEVRAEGWLPSRTEVEVAGRRRVEVELTLERAEVTQVTEVTEVTEHTTVEITEEGGAPPQLFYAGLGMTAVGLAAAGAFGIFALTSKGQTEGENPLDYDAIEAGNDTTATWALLTDASLGVAAAFGVTTLILYFVTDWDDDEQERAREAADTEARVELYVAPNGIGGRF